MITRRKSFIVAATLLAAVLVAACGSSSGSSGGGSGGNSKQQADVTGTTWLLDSTRLLAGTTDVIVSAEFSGGQITGENGCNRYNGPYTSNARKGTMTIGPNLSTTQMACSGIRSSLEQAYMAALPKVEKYTATSQQLSLIDSSGKTILRFTASDPTEAIKGSWEATMIYTGTALQSPVQGSTLTAVFDGTQISGDSGCNTFSGTYSTSGDTITIGTLASTQRACADPAVDTQEQQYLSALGQAKTFTVAGNRLDLYREDGGYAASYTRSRASSSSSSSSSSTSSST